MATPEESLRRQEVRQVKAASEQDLMKLPNVTGVFTGTKVTGGVDTGQIAIVVTVSEKKDVPARSRIPEEVNGVPTDVIEEKIEPMQVVNAIRLEDIVPFVDTTNYPTLEGGMSIGPCRSIFLEPPDAPEAGNYVFVGTLGCIVTDNATNDPMMLSNFHVMCVDNTWSAGDTMAQPSRVDGGACPADLVGALQRAQLTPSVDGAVGSISGRPHTCEILEIGTVNGTAVAAEKMAVRKRGRTTELTHGIVSAIDYTTAVDYGDGLGVITFTDQIRIENDPAQSAFFGKKGDSGSVVVNEDNEVVGLFFAGNETGTVGVANQIAAVESALNVTVCGGGGIKKFEKEFLKDFAVREKDWYKLEKVEIKEIEKERYKDFIKDWKEYAYEKFDWENVYDPWDRINPWERPPIAGQPPGRPGLTPRVPGIQPRVPGFRGTASASGRMGGWKEVPVQDGCAEFGLLPVGAGPNPVVAPPFYVTILDYTGIPQPMTQVVNWGAHTGLNAGWTAEIKLDGECPVVQATLVHFAHPATMVAYNADGSLAGTATMGDTQNVAQTLTIEGSAIAYVQITSPQDETILVSLCCCDDTACKSCEEEKPFLADHKTIRKDKEIFKELKEPKEFKELKEKEVKEKDFKELKEPKEFKEFRETGLEQPPVQPPPGRDSVEERLAAIESVMGMSGASHFITQELRPDLSRGALRREPGGGTNRARLRRQGGG